MTKDEILKILEAMDAIERFVEGMEQEEFKQDDKTSSAVIRKFEIIGEVAKRVPESIRRKYPQVPWREMADMRDRLIRAYFDIKYDIVWRAIKQRIPPIKPIIRQIADELEE